MQLKSVYTPALDRGFTLIEVLVALLVLSFGVLASLGLQVAASSNVQNSSQRLAATNLANDLFSRIRTNFSDSANDQYLLLTQDEELGGAHFATRPSPNCGALGTTCTPAELAAYDLWEWERLLDGHNKITPQGESNVATGGLVDPAACVFGPAAGGAGFYQVVIVWRSTTESVNPVFGGTSPTPEEANTNSCGNATNQYGPDNVNRRVLSMTTFISSL